ncbi:putative protein RMD5 -like protein A-like [Capsicum annuum]|uniref:uncharacterized protein LOC107879459 n=1 Tax=Capsicum annuum TaxID=4072 RepID=UPI001FB197B4|nr:uncharacterized protein LOC107879459 [Capsicum annuum]KAF3676865.1 putative protein RMD5 -like protein A-like [Capsicum annuum]
MALRIHLFCPNAFPSQSPNFKTCWIPSMKDPPKFQKLCCTNNQDMSDSKLALDFATEVGKMNTHVLQKTEALKKSKKLLFMEFCNYNGLKSEEMKMKWKKISEEEKWVLIKSFVVEWGAHFHPLSARSVKELVDEYLVENTTEFTSSSTSFFPGLKKLMGFPPDDNE